MRTDLDLVTNPLDIAEITRADFVGYYHPREIVADPLLTIARKRALLARWLSDANALPLPNAPAFRRSPAGVTATVDEIRLALDKLDEMVEAVVLAGRGRASGVAA
jgi:hypothetical protein